MIRLAKFSDCAKYRYWLLRAWDESKPTAMCIGLNPSTANGERDDRTISFLITSLGDLGFGSFYMTNLYAFIASKPEVLLAAPDKLKDNDQYLAAIRKRCDTVIYCWGAYDFVSVRVHKVKELTTIGSFPNFCFGKSKNGAPLHPMAFVRRGRRITALQNF